MEEITVDLLPIIELLEEIQHHQQQEQLLILVVCCLIGIVAGLLLIRILTDRM